MLYIFLGPPLTSTLVVYSHLDDHLQKRLRKWKKKLEKRMQIEFSNAVDAKALELVEGLIEAKRQGGPSGHGGEGGPSGHGGEGSPDSTVE